MSATSQARPGPGLPTLPLHQTNSGDPGPEAHPHTPCLDWVLIRGERHLDRVLGEFVQHYNCERPHRGIDLEVPVPHPTMARLETADAVERVDRLGGLVHEYRVAA